MASPGCIEATNWIPDRLLTHATTTWKRCAGLPAVCSSSFAIQRRRCCAPTPSAGRRRPPSCASLLIHTKVQTLAARMGDCEGARVRESSSTYRRRELGRVIGSGTRPNPLSIALEKICAELRTRSRPRGVYARRSVGAARSGRDRRTAAASTAGGRRVRRTLEHSPRMRAGTLGVPAHVRLGVILQEPPNSGAPVASPSKTGWSTRAAASTSSIGVWKPFSSALRAAARAGSRR